MPSVTRKPRAAGGSGARRSNGGCPRATEQLMSDGFAFTELSVDRPATESGISRATFSVYFEDR